MLVLSPIYLSVSWLERLNEKHPDRIRFYLTKADTAGDEKDRQVRIGVVWHTKTLGEEGHRCCV